MKYLKTYKLFESGAIDTYGEKSINYYNNYLSTDATSKFIIETINNKFV